MVRRQFLHGPEDLRVLRQIEILRLQALHGPEHNAGILQHGAEDAGFRFQAVGLCEPPQLLIHLIWHLFRSSLF